MMKEMQKQENIKKEEEDRQTEIDNKIKEEEHQKRLNGTRVTPETFFIWREKFLKEKEEIEIKESDEKPTGRQLFEKNKDLFTDDNYDNEEIVINEELYDDDVDVDDIEEDDEDEENNGN